MKSKKIDTIKIKKVKKINDKSTVLIPQVSRYSKRVKQSADLLFNKLTNMISSTKYREKKIGRESHLSIGQLIHLCDKYIGLPCKYCGDIITHNNISIDHIIPIDNQGESKIENIQFICIRCNRIKGIISDNEMIELFKFLDGIDLKSRKYLLGKLSSKSVWIGK